MFLQLVINKWFLHPRKVVYFFWKMGSNPICLRPISFFFIYLINRNQKLKMSYLWTEPVILALVRRGATFCLSLLLSYHHNPAAPAMGWGPGEAWERAPQRATMFLHHCRSEGRGGWERIQILCSVILRLDVVILVSSLTSSVSPWQLSTQHVNFPWWSEW